MAGVEEHNEKVVASLRRRQFRLAAVFYGGLIAIPLGVICPCGLAAAVYRYAGPDWSQPVALSSFLLPLVGLAAALLVLGGRSRARRSIAVAQLADSLGLRYTETADKDRLAFLAPFPVLSAPKDARFPGGSGANLLEGTYKRRPLVAVDYTTLHYFGKHFVRSRTVAVFTAGFERLPAFAVAPALGGEALERFLLGTSAPGKKIALPDEKEFNRQCTVLAPSNRAAVVACLTPAVVDLFLEDKRLGAEVHEGMLLVYRLQTIAAATEYEEFLRTANRLAKALEAAKG